MAEHPIEGLMKSALDSIAQMIDVNTILGDPVETSDGHVIMPVSKVSLGFAAGGTEWRAATGASAPGHVRLRRAASFRRRQRRRLSLNPMGFLVLNNSGVGSCR